MVVGLRFGPSGIGFCAESVSTASFDNPADDDWNSCQRMRIEIMPYVLNRSFWHPLSRRI